LTYRSASDKAPRTASFFLLQRESQVLEQRHAAASLMHAPTVLCVAGPIQSSQKARRAWQLRETRRDRPGEFRVRLAFGSTEMLASDRAPWSGAY
jgi:hypothetical protein